MKLFFAKKNLTALLLLVAILGFSAANLLYGKDALLETLTTMLDIQKIEDVDALVAGAEEAVSEQLLYKVQFVEVYGYIQKLLFKTEIDNFTYGQDDNGFLNDLGFFREEDSMLPDYAQRVARLKDIVEEKGGKLLLVTPPCKYDPQGSAYAPGYPVNDANAREDALLLYAHEAGVDTMDLRESLRDFPYQERFFKADHHWTIQAAFAAYSAIVQEFEDRYDLLLDPENFYRDINNYDVYTYKQAMLGSMGRNTGVVFSGLDDYTLIVPKFPTHYINTAKEPNGMELETEGTFEEALLDTVHLSTSNIYSNSLYSVYLQEVRAWNRIVNTENPDGPKLFCVRDSYFTPVVCFLSPMFSEIHMIWPLGEGAPDVERYVRENDFDYVIVEVYPYNINDDMFDFCREALAP